MHGALWVSFHSGESISVSCGWANVGHAAPVTAFGIWPKCCALWCFALKFSSTGSLQSLLHSFNNPIELLSNIQAGECKPKAKDWSEDILFFYLFLLVCFILFFYVLLIKQPSSYCPVSDGIREYLPIHPQSTCVSLKECRLIAEQTLLSKTSDRWSLSSIGLDPAACHLSHLNGPRGDLSVALELHTLLALTQSNARSAFGGRSGGSH